MDPTRVSLKALKLLPRFTEKNLVKPPWAPKREKYAFGPYRKRWPNKSNEERQRWHPIGYEQGQLPWYLKVPAENYYEKFDARRQYPPFNLQKLQLCYDMGLIDGSKPVDLAALCNTNHYEIIVSDNHYGVHLTMEGIDNFYACLNIEVQYAKEPVIAAIERNGGRITTAYYDIKSVAALADPHKFFKLGEPIPKRMLPPPNAIDYYTDPKNRGYLADPAEVEKERFKLAQKYGYEIPEITDENKKKVLNMKKHKRQVFYGLEAGYVVNLRDKEILEPSDTELREYYGLPSLSESQYSQSQPAENQ